MESKDIVIEPCGSGSSMSGRPPPRQQPELDNGSTSRPSSSTMPPPNLLNVPTEVILLIAQCLNYKPHLHGSLGDAGLQSLARWARTCRYFNDKLEPELYDKGVIRHPYLLCWATDIGDQGLMRKILAAKDAAILPQTGMLRFSPDHEYGDLDSTKPFLDLFKKHYRVDVFFDRNMAGVVRWNHRDNNQAHDILQREAAMYWFSVHIAARNGNIPALDLLLAHGAQLNMPSRGSCVDRHRPRRKRSPLLADWYIPNTVSRKYPSWTPFHVALSRGHQETATYILNRCPNISDRLLAPDEGSNERTPPLISAFRHGCFEAAEGSLTTLVDDATKGDDATRLYPGLGDHTLLYRVLRERGNFGRALDILVRNGADVNRVEDGEALLVWACLGGHFKRALALVAAGARTDVNVRTTIQERGLGKLRGRGTVHVCCEERHLAAYRGRPAQKEFKTSSASRKSAAALVDHILTDKRASKLVKDRWLNHAADNNQPEILEVLLRHGADANAASQKITLLESLVRGIRYCRIEGYEHVEEAVKLLFEYARRSGTSLRGGEGFFYVLAERLESLWVYSEPIVRALLLLIKEGVVDVNERNRWGATCLMENVFRLMRWEQEPQQPLRGKTSCGRCGSASWPGLVAGGLGDEWSRAMLRLLVEIDAEHWIFKEPRFLAKAMVGGQGCIVEALVDSAAPKLQLDASWRNSRGPTGFNPDHRLGWTMLHCAAYAGCVEVTKRLLQEGAPIVDAVMYDCFGKLL
ncbi:tnni3 interacting kinase [Colletotrichum sojae]|uniref:Tnni3 interacting kinase n=1 Tax=Colletotrichum sojae TaxID=2175907 RepID=A0A8H6MQU6_9PEZI|nr:tnni3 interacting kinase [Colletotrichum sojae]